MVDNAIENVLQLGVDLLLAKINIKHLQQALTNVYKLDKSVCAKHLAALDGCSVSYRDRSENARRSAAQKRQKQRLAANVPDDPIALQGPPDRACHFDKLGKSMYCCDMMLQ